MKYWYVCLRRRTTLPVCSVWEGVVDDVEMWKISNGEIWWIDFKSEVNEYAFGRLREHQSDVQFSIYE